MSGDKLGETGSDGSVEFLKPLGGFEGRTEDLGILEEKGVFSYRVVLDVFFPVLDWVLFSNLREYM